jgi:hypothetical protein
LISVVIMTAADAATDWPRVVRRETSRGLRTSRAAIASPPK